MPKVTIREVDLTGSENAEYLDHVVLVPAYNVYAKDAANAKDVFKGILTSIEDLKVLYNSSDTKTRALIYNGKSFIEPYSKDSGVKYVFELLRYGLPVFYLSAYTIESNKQVLNKVPTDELDPSGSERPMTLAELYEPFKDKGKYDLRFITIGGLKQVYDAADTAQDPDKHPYASIEALKCASERGDAVAILDVPTDQVKILKTPATSSTAAVYSELLTLNSTALIDKWVQQEYASVCNEVITRDGVSWTNAEQKTETRGRYGAIFAPECTVVSDGTSIKVPASLDYLVSFGKMITAFPAWFATAGAIRGVSKYVSLKPTIEFGDADVDSLQRRATSLDTQGNVIGKNHVAVNVIANIRPYGYVIWGNRTMHPLSAPSNSSGSVPQLVASSFLNIRQLCTEIKKTLYRASRRFTFDPNSDTLWSNFKNAITPLLDEMKANQGINGYQIVKIKTNKKALLVARIKIIPIEAVEDFDLTIELADSIEVTE